MAQADWPAGSELIVRIDGDEYPFKTVTLADEADMINRSNSKYAPRYKVKRSGQLNRTVQADGPYREGETPLGVGEEYTVFVAPTASHIGFETLMLLKSVEFSDDVENAPNMRASFEAQGEFHPVVL